MRAYDAAWAASDFTDTPEPGGATRSVDPPPPDDRSAPHHQKEQP